MRLASRGKNVTITKFPFGAEIRPAPRPQCASRTLSVLQGSASTTFPRKRERSLAKRDRAAQVTDHLGSRDILVTAQQGAEDTLVAGKRCICRIGRDRDQIANTRKPDLVVADFKLVFQKCILRKRCDRDVEKTVQSFEFIVALLAGASFLLVQDIADLGDIIVGCASAAEDSRCGFNGFSKLENLSDSLDTRLVNNVEAAPPADQLLLMQPLKRFPHWGSADAISLGNLIFLKQAAGGRTVVDQISPDGSVKVFSGQPGAGLRHRFSFPGVSVY